jgi:hypothetical protein
MTNFVLLYSGGSGMPSSEAEQKAALGEWNAWFGKLASALVDGGSPFSMSKSIDTSGKVSDGPAGTMASGYSIIKADSLDAATKLAQGCPVLKSGAKITVYETVAAPGM